MLTTRIFINQLKDLFNNKDNKLCFIVGAGASVASGIKSGSDLAYKWYHELPDFHTTEEIAEWKAKVSIDENNLPAYYAQLFSFRYQGTSQRKNGIEFINAEIEKGRPGFGYTVFAQLLAKTHHNVVITTNFDTLSEESLYIYTNKRPQVISHENLAEYATPSSTRPLILKIHRDRFMDPINDSDGVNEIKPQWKNTLQTIFSQYLPIVVGYGGNDGSLMKYLMELSPRTGLYWCVRDKEPSNQQIKDVVSRHGGEFVSITSFDHLMCQFLTLFKEDGVMPVHTELEKLAKDRADQFGNDFVNYTKETSETRTEEENFQLQQISDDFDPNKWWHWELRASSFENPTDQINIYNEALTKLGENQELYFNRGNTYANKGEYDLAIADYNEAIRLKPDDAGAYNNRGIAFRHKGEYDLAIADYNEAIRLKPDYADAYNNRGVVYRKKGEYDLAIADYNEVIRLKPDNAIAYSNRGIVYDDRGEYDFAIADYDEAIRLKPDFALAYNNRGVTYRNKGEYDLAIADYNEAIRLKPDDADYFNNRGITYRNNGDYNFAIADYTEAIRLKPDFTDVYNNRGKTYRNKGEYDLAIADYNEAIRLKPDFADAYNNRGIAYRNKGEYDLAIADYNEAIRLKPDFALAYNNRGVTYRNKGEYDLAIADYSEAIRLKPDYADAYNNRGVSYDYKAEKSQGDIRILLLHSIADYQKALDLNPALSKAKTCLAKAQKRLEDLDK